MKKYKFNIYSHSNLIGYSDFEYGDVPMGTVHGKFFPSENFKKIEGEIKDAEVKNDFSALELSVIDSMSGQTIKNIFIAIFTPPEHLQTEPLEITMNGIPYQQYEDIFPQHVELYKDRFDNKNVTTSNKKQTTYEILVGLPQDDSVVIPVGNQPFYSEGFVVRFFNEDGTSWVGNFPSGSSFKGVYEYPERGETLIFTGGEAYRMNLHNPKTIKNFGSYFQQVLSDEKGRVVMYDYTAITVIEPSGEQWTSKRISWDDFKDVKVKDNIVGGLSYEPMGQEGRWEPFSLNLITKEVTGGSYDENRFLPTTKKFSLLRVKTVVSIILALLLCSFFIFVIFDVQKVPDSYIMDYGIGYGDVWMYKSFLNFQIANAISAAMTVVYIGFSISFLKKPSNVMKNLLLAVEIGFILLVICRHIILVNRLG